MNKVLIMKRLDEKETKGCFRYGLSGGDAGIDSLYVKKETISGVPPKFIDVKITGRTTPHD